MLEIVLLYFLCKSMGQKLRAKGRKPLPLQILLVLMWLGGEFVGGAVGGVVPAIRHGNAPMEFEPWVYLLAVIGAGCGAGFCFLIAWLLPPAYDDSARGRSYLGGTSNPNFPPPDPNNPYSSPRTPT
jgi:hypothetical protein